MNFLHTHGVVHRDLKTENILLSGDFILKIADFGHSKSLSEISGGKTYTFKGTESYNAPEILARRGYNPQCTDLFGCGVILFIMAFGVPPFSQAKAEDYWYNLLMHEKHDKFWSTHIEFRQKADAEAEKSEDADDSNDAVTFGVSEEFQQLVSALLALNPIHRPSMADLVSHPWLHGPVPTQEEVKVEFIERMRQMQKKKEREQRKREEAKKQVQAKGAGAARRQYRNVDCMKVEEEEVSYFVKGEQKVQAYQPLSSTKQSLIEIASEEGSPEEIMNSALLYFVGNSADINVHPSKFRAICTIFDKEDEGKLPVLTIQVELFSKVGGSFILQVDKLEGNHFEFLKFFKEYDEYISL